MVDIFFGLLLSLILLPLIIIVAIIVKFDSDGPIFFISERIGLDNKNLRCLNLDNVYKHRDNRNIKNKKS